MKPWTLIAGVAAVLALVVLGAMVMLRGGMSASSYAALDGPALYGKLCSQCHGDRGTAPRGLANSYANKLQYWDEKSLLKYIANPSREKPKTPHLRGSARVMPALSRSVPMEARKKLVAHVLGLMEALEPSVPK